MFFCFVFFFFCKHKISYNVLNLLTKRYDTSSTYKPQYVCSKWFERITEYVCVLASEYFIRRVQAPLHSSMNGGKHRERGFMVTATVDPPGAPPARHRPQRPTGTGQFGLW